MLLYRGIYIYYKFKFNLCGPEDNYGENEGETVSREYTKDLSQANKKFI